MGKPMSHGKSEFGHIHSSEMFNAISASQWAFVYKMRDRFQHVLKSEIYKCRPKKCQKWPKSCEFDQENLCEILTWNGRFIWRAWSCDKLFRHEHSNSETAESEPKVIRRNRRLKLKMERSKLILKKVFFQLILLIKKFQNAVPVL